MKIIDWQFISSMVPFMDFAFLAFTSNSPEFTATNSDQIMNSYYGNLQKTCQKFQLKVPFSFQEFIKETYTKGFPTMLILYLYFYDPVGLEPNMAKRLRWVFEKIIKENADFFD